MNLRAALHHQASVRPLPCLELAILFPKNEIGQRMSMVRTAALCKKFGRRMAVLLDGTGLTNRGSDH